MTRFTDCEAEQYLLGRLMLNNHALAKIKIRPEYFSDEFHADLFAAMQKLFQERGSFRVLELKQLYPIGEPGDKKNNREYIQSLAEAIITSIDFEITEGADYLRELYRKRHIWQALSDAEALLDSTSSSEIMLYLNRMIGENIDETAVKTQIQTQEEIRQALVLPAERFKTGLKRLDDALGGGLYAGFTYGLCGAEKSGKTTLAHTISFQLDCPHLYVAMEMGARQIEQRNVARELGVNSLMFLENAPKLLPRMNEITAKNNVFYLDAPGASMDEILYNASSSIIQHKIKGMIVDYWQLIGGQQRGETEEKHLRQCAQKLADFARKNKIWCVLLAQMNKAGELFGGNGLRKACDQLFMIEQAEQIDDARWLRMDASRYTMKSDVGTAQMPGLALQTKTGPYFYDPDQSKLF